MNRILVTGATGKVGRHFIDHVIQSGALPDTAMRALCHNRILAPHPRLEMVQGNISDRAVVRKAMEGVTHVLHCATCKETPDDVMDVAVKGLFWLLEESRVSPTFRQFILLGGDCTVGHFFYPHLVPGTEQQKLTAYPGCYALSKVLEEVMLEQYYIQYDFNGCCLRAPWIMEKDDFKFQLSFGDDIFGGIRWRDYVGAEKADEYIKSGTIPIMQDAKDHPLQRNFVHVEDLATAILCAIDHPKARQQLFNICMDEPVDYGAVAQHLQKTRGLASVEIPSDFHSNWMDNAKAKYFLGWRPRVDLAKLIDAAYDYKRAADDPRKVWYPG